LLPVPRRLSPEEKIRRWKGGQLRIFLVERVAREIGPDESGRMLYEIELLDRSFIYEVEAIPLGDGFALEQPAIQSGGDDPPVEMEYGIRDGRLECVRISAVPDGPPLTSAMLRRLAVDRRVRAYARHATYRLEVDEQGEVIGVRTSSPRDREDLFRTPAMIEAELGGVLRRPGRPPLDDAELQRVAEVVREAEARRETTAAAVAEVFSLTLDAAKKRIQKARQRGFLPPAKKRRRSNNG
jgi:hypothetical protein